MPLFSAATKGEYKQCFDTLQYDATAPFDTSEWSDDFFGPALSSVKTMHVFEQKYLDQLDSAITLHHQFDKAEEYFTNPTQTDTIDTLGQDIVGFMWYNYSTLRDTFRTVVNYNRYLNSNLKDMNLALLHFNNQSSLLSIYFTEETEDENAQLKVLNTQGQVVLLAEVNRSNRHFNLDNLPPGIYLCQLKSSGKINSKKINILNK
jgi:hypothetical protein